MCVLFYTAKGEFITKRVVETTKVEFSELSDKIIKAYSKSDYPWGKAGGYCIQDIGISMISGI